MPNMNNICTAISFKVYLSNINYIHGGKMTNVLV